MNKNFKLPELSLVLLAIVLQIALIFGFYGFSFFPVDKSKEIELQVKLPENIATLAGDKIDRVSINYEISILDDYNGYNGNQNYNLNDEVYVSLNPSYGGNSYNYGSLGKTKPGKEFGFNPTNVVIKGRVVEVIKPNQSNYNDNYQTVPVYPEPNPYGVYNYSSSSSSYSYNSSNSDDLSKCNSYSVYDPETGKTIQKCDTSNVSSSSSSYSATGYSSSSYSSYYAPYFRYKIVYGIEDYQIAEKNMELFRKASNIKAVIKVNENGDAEFKYLKIDDKKVE